MTGHDLIKKERRRQIEDHGFLAERDDAYTKEELCAAAECYESAGDALAVGGELDGEVPATWPWHSRFWKPSTDPARNWVKAGALYQAESERLFRKASPMRAARVLDFVHRCAEKIDLRTGVKREDVKQTHKPGLVPVAYRLPWSRLDGNTPSRAGIVAVGFRDGMPVLWRVRECFAVLSKSGEWEHEPNPSSRSYGFIERTSWPTVSEAYHAAEEYFTKAAELVGTEVEG